MNSEAFVIPDDLVSAARTGDPGALSNLWESCAPILHTVLRRQRARPASLDRAELSQEAAVLFLELLHREPKPGVAPEPFGRHFARALYWRLHDVLRAERRRMGRQTVASEEDLELALRRRAGGHSAGGPGVHLDRALARLSPRQRAVIGEVYFRDRAITAIAGDLGLSADAVSALHRRALTTMREVLSNESAGETVSDQTEPIP